MPEAGKYSVIVAHPNATSFNHAIAKEAVAAMRAAGATVYSHDLYAENFNPVLGIDEVKRRFTFDPFVQSLSAEAKASDGFVFVHPDWWGMPPAVLKGYLDRVFRPGIAYDYVGAEFETKKRTPLFGGKRAVVLVTTDKVESPEYPLELLWKDEVFAFCGIAPSRVEILWDVRNSTHRSRRDWLDQVAATIQTTLF